jgi:hypothetical protein
MASKNNPGRYDCYANAHPDEPMFVLLGRDKMAASLVRLWAEARFNDGEHQPKVEEAMTCATTQEDWARAQGKDPVNVLDFVGFDTLASALRRRGATVTPAPHGGDFARENAHG